MQSAPKHILLAFLLLLLFNYPLLSAANRSALAAGIPVLYWYIGIVWIAAILVLIIITQGKTKRRDE